MASSIYEFHPSDGLSYDLNTFIEEFKSKNSFQFLDFAEVWKKQNFFELILGRMSMEAIKDFLNCLFHYLVDLIQNTSDKLFQTCAMFMMYGFYGKLPSKNIVFIRVTLSQWKTINELIQFYRVEEHLDCLYVFHCLCSSGAFQFCATRQPNYPNVPLYANLNNIRAIIFKSEELNVSENETKPNDSYIVNTLDKLSETYRKYYEYKKPLFPIAKNSLGLLHERVMGELKKFQIDNQDDITLVPRTESDLTKLIGSFVGFENTPYDGGKYEIDVEIPANFPFEPPKARFITRVWHPNISSATGYICLDLLKVQAWAPGISLKNVLTSIKTLLIIAQPDDPQDATVASQYMENKEMFEKTASYWNHIFANGPSKPYFEEMNRKVSLLVNQGLLLEEAIHQLSMVNWKIEETE